MRYGLGVGANVAVAEGAVQRSRPLVGIVVATFNRAKLVSRAIESALDQTYPNVRVVVVDDGSTDDTPAVLQRYATNEKIRLLRHAENRGATASFNTGLSGLGDAQFFALLGSDDALRPDAVESLVRVFEVDLDRFSLAAGWAQDMHSRTTTGSMRHLRAREGMINLEDAVTGSWVGDFWVLARRDLLGDVRFEERATTSEGAVWWRLLRLRPGWLVPQVLLEVDRTGADRLSLPSYTPTSALRMMWSRKTELDAGGKDLRRANPGSYAGKLAEMAKWAALAGEGRRARAASRQSLRVAPTLRGILMVPISTLPPSLLRPMIQIWRRLRGRVGEFRP